jgi:hypothetical protein
LKILRAVLLLALFIPQVASAHIGSKDVFEQVNAGPYKLFVTIRMPDVIPGVANVEVRSTGAPVTELKITPTPITGEASKHPPTPDTMKASSVDPAFYTGGVWMMSAGSWEIRLDVSGAVGNSTVSVPVPAVAIATLQMQRSLGVPLAILGLFLIVSMAGVIGAAVREARLPAGAPVTAKQKRRGMLATAGGLVVMALMVWGGAKWWHVEAASYADDVYHPPVATAELTGDQLNLKVEQFVSDKRFRDPATANLLPDHGHLIHLYAIREPEMDAAYHLHPELIAPGHFQMDLPAMPPGEYTLYGDVVHANGFPETLVTKLQIPADMPGGPLASEDASAHPAPLSHGQLGNSYKLPDGYTMVWERPAILTSITAYSFRFHLVGPDGQPVNDMLPYLGMAGHAAFVKTDGTVFAHTHPEGSAAMPAVMLANGMDGGMVMASEPVTSTVEFPYGFPKPGNYRIFIQMKHGLPKNSVAHSASDGVVETGVFDAVVQ